MNQVSLSKSVTKSTASVANSATFTHNVDGLGFEAAHFDVIYSPFTAAAAAYALVLTLGESDSAGATNASTISAFTVTANAGSTTGADNGAVARFNVDLRGRKRYLTVSTTPALTVAVTSSVRLSKAEDGAITATLTGVNSLKEG